MKDRRVRKTQKAIQDAFAKLLSKKNIEDITIKELCNEADINKSTFYLHYKDIYDCADNLMNSVIDRTIAVMEPYDFTELIDHLPVILENIILIFNENKELYLPILNSPRHSFVQYQIKKLTINRLLEKTTNSNINTILNKCLASFVVCGILGVLEQVKFDEITPETASVLTDKIQNGFIYAKNTF
ncbi:TetR family transcriptional regulator [Clostridium gelidum]|uniref:TetR family transcriptional regulator n=1 Tax=Clostridium gelidum TaxID=704125 RepID=A0ABM7T5I9_9CLOT|nr:TetR/AcrR family transcriptional regulator [Clostridium gelidum]BCZ44240.1 TetR family transcriptional regulator [Clostridium gelidum]